VDVQSNIFCAIQEYPVSSTINKIPGITEQGKMLPGHSRVRSAITVLLCAVLCCAVLCCAVLLCADCSCV
jgi:hypothetical protein